MQTRKHARSPSSSSSSSSTQSTKRSKTEGKTHQDQDQEMSTDSKNNTSLPSEMKAFQMIPSSKTATINTIAVPSAGAGQLLVRVYASSLNPLDWKFRDFNFLGFASPTTLGNNFSGVVAAVGAGVGDFKVGDEVFGSVPINFAGSHAEYVVVPSFFAGLKPASLSHVQASTLGVTFFTAWEGIVTVGKVTANDSVYIPGGGSGGVGSCAVLIAKSLGAKVFTSASRASSLEFCKKELKADGAFNYKDQDWVATLKKLNGGALPNVVFDSTYQQSFESAKGVAENGRWVGLGEISAETPARAVLAEKKAQLLNSNFGGFSFAPPDVAAAFFQDAFSGAVRLFNSGALPIFVSKTVSLSETPAALDELKTGGDQIGKVVVRIASANHVKAVQMITKGHPLQLVEIPAPAVGDDEILVEVRAASLNPVDWKIREYNFFGATEARTLGFDFSGVVVRVGKNVTDFKGGESVYGANNLKLHGAFSEYIVTTADRIALKPKTLSFVEAASVGVALLSAWEGLVTFGHVSQNDTVFIPGGAGGVASFAVEIAKAHGARVITSASRPASIAFCQNELKVETFNYKEKDAVAAVKAWNNGQLVSVVYDATYAFDGFSKIAETLAQGGRFIGLGQKPNDDNKVFKILAERKATYVPCDLVKYTADLELGKTFIRPALEKASELFESGAIRTHVTKVIHLSEVNDFLDAMKSGKEGIGKIVVQVL